MTKQDVFDQLNDRGYDVEDEGNRLWLHYNTRHTRHHNSNTTEYYDWYYTDGVFSLHISEDEYSPSENKTTTVYEDKITFSDFEDFMSSIETYTY